jgi:hypothetical protein
MDAILATIVDSGQEIDVIYREGVEIHYFLLYFINSTKTLQRWPQGMHVHQDHAAGDENGSIMVGMFESLCLTSQKPYERDFLFPPERT